MNETISEPTCTICKGRNLDVGYHDFGKWRTSHPPAFHKAADARKFKDDLNLGSHKSRMLINADAKVLYIKERAVDDGFMVLCTFCAKELRNSKIL